MIMLISRRPGGIMKRLRGALALMIMIAALAVSGPVPAQAASAILYGPTRLTGIAAPGGVTIHLIDTITSGTMQAGQSAYIYASMNAYDATQVTLVDNEVICTGAAAGSFVMGENIDPANSANEDRHNITILTRFLVSATTTGTTTCKLYYRGHSLVSGTTSALTVRGEFKFADEAVGESAGGAAMQTSLPNGNTNLTTKTYIPLLDTTLATSQTAVDVIADVEFMSCALTGGCPNSWDTSSAKFTLVVEQMDGSTVCATAPAAQLSVTVLRQTHHKAVPLYTKLNLVPGCRRLYAYVRGEYTGGAVGAIQGTSVNLPDADGSGSHESVMTHLFALPR
ncbi:hypothetical protein [Microlunatus sp. GCM10028923]|uniref:hypothetical protein n=1 Tax=Microlunatus sp. GCM10028923 TaxID=3273400 RepID=UPI003622D306